MRPILARVHPLHYLLLGCALSLLLAQLVTSSAFLLPNSDPTWRAIQSRGTWRVGMDPSFPPFESLDGDGKPVGYDLDLAALIADEWEVQLEIVPIGFDGLLDALQAGQVDGVISALPFDPLMTKDVTYSEPYFEAGIRLAVRGAEADTFVSQASFKQMMEGTARTSDEAGAAIRRQAAALLKGQTVAVEWGSMGDMIGRQLQRIEPTITLQPFETAEETIFALQENSTIKSALVDNITLKQVQGMLPIDNLAVVGIGPAIEGNPYVIALPHRSIKLQKEVNDLLQMFQTTGKLSDLEAIWFTP